jgi:pimeloyl-ACP methyl ester carboxylesterase
MAPSALQKSTNVRMIRRAARIAESLAPGLAARMVSRVWFTLPRPAHGAALPPGGTAFEVLSQGSVVRGAVWGEGPVVYLVHGWAGRGSQLAAFVEPLVRRGHRVVLFDALSHGDSGPGPHGRASSSGVELARSLDDVAARFGRAHAVVAHSMGGIATLLAHQHGWLGVDRLALVAPMSSYATQFEAFADHLGLGARTRDLVDRLVEERVGLPTSRFDLGVLARDAGSIATLVVHDRGDRQTPYGGSVRLVERMPDARMVTTHGLGHRRVLADARVVDAVTSFVAGAELVDGLRSTA